MKFVNYVLAASIAFMLFACTQTTINYVVRVRPVSFDESQIYETNRVVDFIFDTEEQNPDSIKQSSRQLFLKGVDLFKNEGEIKEAIGFFKRSILCYPDAKSYYELGNALLESGHFDADFEQAYKAYEVAQELNFQPRSILSYKKACTMNRKSKANSFSVGYELAQAFDEGFSDTLMLKSDKHLQSFVNSPEFDNLRVKVILKEMKEGQDDLFAVYRKLFTQVPDNFEIKKEVVDMRDYKQFIPYEFSKFVPEMQTSSFGRDVSHEFIYVGRLPEKENYSAVLYASVSYYGEYMQPVHTRLVTYNPAGKIISSMVVAGQFSAERIKSLAINTNEISITEYKRVWEQPIDKVSFDENRVKDYELFAKAVYSIDNSGKIVEVSVPDNFKDSIQLAKN